MPELLFEIGTEEIPAGYIAPACRQLEENFQKMAEEAGLSHKEVTSYATPRRLVLRVADLAASQKDIDEELLGPSTKVAIDAEGNLTRAGIGFARSKGVDPSELQVVDTPKGEYMMLRRRVKGEAAAQLLPGILAKLITGLSFPKSMRWGTKKQSFARPIQWLAALFGDEVIRFTHEGITSGDRSSGHRFTAGDPFVISSIDQYERLLEERDVIVDPRRRREMVVAEIRAAVAAGGSFPGGEVQIDDDLVDTVTNLVENPVGVCGTYDKKFLQLVPEVLITSMREHQKYFPVVAADGSLLPGFVAVNNTRVNTEEVTRQGHQRVLRARLEDALFFYKSDQKIRLDQRVEKLSGIIFQAELGSMLEKKTRLVKLAELLAGVINPELIADVCRAAELCKADLLTDMVGEFPSLQGIMGADYAAHDGENEVVCGAIREHYMPKRSGAELPSSDAGAILALADRIDTIAGLFGIGQIPTGSADPFALRRQSLAVLRIIIDRGWRFSLREILARALFLYGDKVDASAETVDRATAFLRDRFINDSVRSGQRAAAIEAAAAAGFDDVVNCCRRTAALAEFNDDDSFAVLAAAFKRIRNITSENSGRTVDPNLFAEEVERELYQLYRQVAAEVKTQIAADRYVLALKAMLTMKGAVDRYFEEVMVMAKEPAVRANRLNLLSSIADLILMVGDISKFERL